MFLSVTYFTVQAACQGAKVQANDYRRVKPPVFSPDLRGILETFPSTSLHVDVL